MKKLLCILIPCIVAVAVLVTVLVLVTSCSANLDAPKNITYDGQLLTWEPVESASGYQITIGDGDSWTVKQAQYPYQAKNTEFRVTVAAVNEDNKVSKHETAVDFKPLATITDVTFSTTGEASWSAIEGATGYQIRLNGENGDCVSLPSYSDLPIGTHKFQVKPIVEGDLSYYALWSDVKDVSILDTPKKDSITYSDGFINWTYISGTQFYKITINGQVVEEACKATSYAYDSKKQAFDVIVQAIGNHVTTFDGKASEVKKFVYLDTVSDIRIEDGHVYWSAINGATGYRIKINGSLMPSALTEAEFGPLSANVSQEISILPICEDTTYFSDWSIPKSVFILTSPTIRWIDGLEMDDGIARSSVVWNSIANAVGYAVKVTSPDGNATVTTVTEPSFAHAYAQAGEYTVEVKALAVGNSDTVYDSSYSTEIKVIRLEAPTAVDKNYIVSDPANLAQGFTVTFNANAKASGYHLYQDNNLVGQKSTVAQFRVSNLAQNGTVEEQTYNYMVQSVGSVRTVGGVTVATLNSLKSDSLKFSITVLAVPSNPTVSGFTYSFGTISNAFGYGIDIAGQVHTATVTNYDLSLLEAGNYSVSVCAKGNGASVLASPFSSPITISRLAAPTNIRIGTADASEGVLTHSLVEYAEGYQIVFDNNDIPLPVNTIENMNQYITEKGTTVYMLASANYFNELKTVYYMTSQPSETVVFIKLATPSFGEVRFNDNQLLWNAPANINTATYTPTYEILNENEVSYNGEKNGTSMDISYLDGGTSYTFYIKAVGDGTHYINSGLSIPVTIYKLATPETELRNGGYTWSGVANASSYAVYIDGVLKKTFTHEAGKTYSYAPDFKELKEYRVEIVAVGDSGYSTINSKPYAIAQKTKQLTTPDFAISYSESAYSTTGNIILTITKPSDFANGYTYTVGGVSYASKETTYAYNPNSTGDYLCRVYANGGGFDHDGIYYLDSQSVGGNDRYRITLLSSPNPSAWKLTLDGALSWTAVSRANGYEIELYINGSSTPTRVETAKVNYQIPDYSSITTLTVKIRALGNNSSSVTSEWAEYSWQNLH